MLELFHRIADPGSAKVRRFVVDHELGEWVRFRNLTYPEVEKDFLARGGKDAPALWDGERLFQGDEAVIARLKAELDLGRAS
jgi:hypothetical protein